MNNSDLIWRLVEIILQQEKDLQQISTDQVKTDTKSNDQKQNEV